MSGLERMTERLVDYLYGELDSAEAAEVQRLLEAKPEWQAELARLRSVMGSLDRLADEEIPLGLANEISEEIARNAERDQLYAQTKTTGWDVLWSLYARIAAVALTLAVLAAVVFMLMPRGGPAFAQDIEVVPQGLMVTVFNSNLALVRDHRLILNLPQGVAPVQFKDIAPRIIPESVRFESATDPLGTRVLVQNYEYDLASPEALLKRFLDHDVQCIMRDGGLVEGKLLSFGGGSEPADRPSQWMQTAYGDGRPVQTLRVVTSQPYQFLLRRSDGMMTAVPGDNVVALKVGERPQGLLTRPTLAWQLRTDRAGRNDMVLSYLTGGMSWRADYVAVLTGPATLSLSAWVTVTNESGIAYPDADLKLMAGDVHRVEDVPHRLGYLVENGNGMAAYYHFAVPEFVEKAFSEYHLYTLQGRTTLKDKQTKQIKLLSADGVSYARKYVFDSNDRHRQARVEVEFTNAKENKLGMPLPKGLVRVQQADPDGELQQVAQDGIDHTPKDEKVTLAAGYAFDVVGERRQIDLRRLGRVTSTRYEIVLHNHKAEPAEVIVREHPSGDWRVTQENVPSTKTDASTLEFWVKLEPNSQRVVQYTVQTR